MAGDMFLKIEGIDGESTDDKHKDEIEIESFQIGVSQAGTGGHGGGRGAGKASFSDATFSKKADKSSPVLMMKCATGEHIKTALLTVRKAGGAQVDYYKVKFSDVLVSHWANSGSGHDSIPMETVSLNFTKIEFDYAVQSSADGSLGAKSHGGWDLATNKSV